VKNTGIGLAAVSLSIVVCSCTTQSGTRVQLDPSSLSQVKAAGVYVKTKEPFSVYMSRDRMSDTGAVIGGLLGAGIEAGVRSSEDEHIAQQVRPSLGDFDMQVALTTNLEQQLEHTGLFSAVQPIDSVSQRSAKSVRIDGILEVTVLQWGLIVCNSNTSDQRLQAGIIAHERLSAVDNNQTLWERDEVHLDGDCHFSSEYETKPDLLRQVSQSLSCVACTWWDARTPRPK
jgi:hypothetical protein